MSDFIYQLGDLRFGTAKPIVTLDRDSEYRWAEKRRLNRKPARQFVGPGTQVITIEGVIYPALYQGNSVAGAKQVEQMREVADAGTPLMLTSGTGQTMGRWVILFIREKQSYLIDNGVPRKQEFTLEIAEYGEGQPGIGIMQRGGGLQVPRVPFR